MPITLKTTSFKFRDDPSDAWSGALVQAVTDLEPAMDRIDEVENTLNALDSDDIANASTNVSGATVTAALESLRLKATEISFQNLQSGSSITVNLPTGNIQMWWIELYYQANNERVFVPLCPATANPNLVTNVIAPLPNSGYIKFIPYLIFGSGGVIEWSNTLYTLNKMIFYTQ